MATKGKKSPFIIIGIILLIIIAIIICFLGIKSAIEKRKVRNSTEKMLEAYMQKDFSKVLSYTEYKDSSEDGIVCYIENMRETSKIDNITSAVLSCSANTLENIALNIVRDYKIEKISLQDETATIYMTLTIPDFSAIPNLLSDEETADMLYATISGWGDVELLPKIKDIFDNPELETVADSIKGAFGEYIEGTINEYFVTYNQDIISADSRMIDFVLKAHKEDNEWVIQIDKAISDMQAEIEKIQDYSENLQGAVKKLP